MKFLRLVLRNTFRNTRRTILTVLAVAVCMFLLTSIEGLLFSMEEGGISPNTGYRIIVQHSTSLASFLPEAHRGPIAAIPGVTHVVGGYWYEGVYIENHPKYFFGRIATDLPGFPETFDDYELDPAGWKCLEETKTGFIAAKDIADKFGWKKGDRIHLTGTIFPVNADLEYCGWTRGTDRTSMFFRRDYLEEALGRPGNVGWFWVRVSDPKDVPRIMETIDKRFENSPEPTRAMTEKQFQQTFMEMMGNVRLLMRNIALAILFTIALVAGNAVSMAVRERGREIAVLKALGFPVGLLLALLVAESLLVVLGGGVLGFGGAWLLYNVAKWDGFGYLQNFSIPAKAALTIAGASAVIALLGLFPSVTAVRRRTADALRRI